MDPVAPGEDVTEAATGNNLHGGNRMAMGEHQYHWHQGRMYNGLLVAMYALKDVNPGDGGFICVPGCARRRPARLGSQYPTAPSDARARCDLQPTGPTCHIARRGIHTSSSIR